jgi:hypothetical protein
MILQQTWKYNCLSMISISMFYLDKKHPEVKLRDTIVVICNFFEGLLYCFFKQLDHFILPTESTPGFQFPHILTNACYLFIYLLIFIMMTDTSQKQLNTNKRQYRFSMMSSGLCPVGLYQVCSELTIYYLNTQR